MILKGYIFSITYVVLCVLGAMLLSKLGVAKKYTRKFIHILVGFEWVILYHYMGAQSPHFLAVCLIFLTLLFVDYKLKLLPAMSSDGDNAPGTVYYALAMSVMATVTMFVPDMILPFGIGVFCTSFGDGFAAVVGQSIKRCNPKIYGGKTLFGSLANLLVSFAVPLVFDNIYGMGLELYHCILIAVISFELELFTGFGIDNIVITLATSFAAYAFVNLDTAMNYVVPVLLTPLIIAFAYRKRALTFGGIIAAIAVDVAVSVALGNFGFVTLITFFAISIGVDKFKKHYEKSKQKSAEQIEKKNDCRDSVQVLANGLAASVCAALYFFTNNFVFIVGFVAALAEACADTVASGVGIFAKRVFDVFKMQECEKGLSGGMSLIGTLSSLVAALAVSLVAFAFGTIDITVALLVTAAAFLGAIFDSLLGSLFQVKYRCSVCSKIIEKEEHCGAKTEKYSGIRFVNNDFVNFASNIFAAIIAILIYLITK